MSDFGISKNAKNRVVFGVEDIDRRLSALATREAGKVVRAGVNAGLVVLSDAIRGQVEADGTFAQSQRSKSRGHRSVNKALAATVGKKFKAGKAGQEVAAKAGFSVGKKRPAGDGNGDRTGVGLTSQDAHWFALGTQQRKTGRKKTRIGGEAMEVPTGNSVQNTGRIKAVRAVSRAGSAIGRVQSTTEAATRSKLEEVTAALARS